jgi:hypothetical protein
MYKAYVSINEVSWCTHEKPAILSSRAMKDRIAAHRFTVVSAPACHKGMSLVLVHISPGTLTWERPRMRMKTGLSVGEFILNEKSKVCSRDWVTR